MRSLVFAFLIGCSASIPAGLTVPAGAESTVHDVSLDVERMSTDVAFGTQTLDRLASHVESLPAADRAVLAGASRELAINCPYNRASFMVPLAVERELSLIDLSAVSLENRLAIVEFKEGVAAHARLLRAIGADALPLPHSPDYLAQVPYELLDGPAFAHAPDAIERSERLVRLIPEMVAEIPPNTMDRLDAARALMEVQLGNQVIRSSVLRLWAETSAKLVPGVQHEASKAHLQRVAHLLDALRGNSC
ncbi:MAG: hypothetical protein AB8H79_25710 [Myxococcota bacterium]